MNDRDVDPLAKVGRQLPAVDLDDAVARRIAHRTRHALGRGLPASRFVEPLVIAVFEIALLGWTVAKVVELLG